MFSPARNRDLGVAAVVVPRRSAALPLGALGLRSSRARPLRRVLSSLLATTVAAAGFASSSCASPALSGRSGPLRNTANGYALEVLVNGAALRTYQYRGETHVMGELGARYTLRVHNYTGQRIEAVASVDGRDAMDGKGADFKKRGYVVAAWSSVDIDGWRLTQAEAAAFRFSSVADSYAARTGNAREVGVIGVAIFPERHVAPPPPLYTPKQSYQPAPHRSEWSSDDERERRGSSGAAKPAAGQLDNLMEGVAPPSKSGIGRSAEAQAPSSAISSRDGMADRPAARAPQKRSGLGTEFGEAVASPVRDVAFARAHATRPTVVLGARYNDRDGLVALGIDVDGCCADDSDLALRQSATPFAGGERRYASPPPGWHRGCCVRY